MISTPPVAATFFQRSAIFRSFKFSEPLPFSPDLPHLEITSGGFGLHPMETLAGPVDETAPAPRPRVSYVFVTGGKGTVILGPEEYPVFPGAWCFYHSALPYAFTGDPSAPVSGYFFHFTGPRIAALMESLDVKIGTVVRSGNPARLAELLDHALDHAVKGTPLDCHAVSSAVELAIVLGAASGRPLQADPALEPEPSRTTYLRCRQYLDRHYAELPSTAAAARACQLSTAYLSRLFQRYDHETPLACLHRLRMNEALRQLRVPHAQAKTVAAGLGFKSAAHFSRAFKSFHGFTPREAWERQV